MQVRSFTSYLEERLDQEEIDEIKKVAQLELMILQNLKSDISQVVKDYMDENNIGFNELSRRLGKSPSQIAKITQGDANLTLASLAQILALIGKKVHIVG